MDRTVSRLGEIQNGVVGRDQVRQAGMSLDQVELRKVRGRWEQDLRGVYRIVGAAPHWRQRLSAAILAGGPGTVASHRAALELHGIMPFGEMVEVATPRPRRFRTSGEVLIHTAMVLPEEDTTVVDGIVLASVERSLLDAGAVVGQRKVQYCVDAAIRLRLTDHERLAAILAARRKRGRRGVRPLEWALEATPEGVVPESRYERAALEIIRDFGLEEPVLQHEVQLPSGRRVRIDLAWPRWLIGAEVDGHGYHSTRGERAYDAERGNELALIGWNILRFTTGQIYNEPGLVGHTLWRALQAAQTRSCDG